MLRASPSHRNRAYQIILYLSGYRRAGEPPRRIMCQTNFAESDERHQIGYIDRNRQLLERHTAAQHADEAGNHFEADKIAAVTGARHRILGWSILKV